MQNVEVKSEQSLIIPEVIQGEIKVSIEQSLILGEVNE